LGNWHLKAVEPYRSPKRNRDFERRAVACVLECGGAPPLCHLVQLRHSAAAVLVFFPAAAGARFVAADFW